MKLIEVEIENKRLYESTVKKIKDNENYEIEEIMGEICVNKYLKDILEITKKCFIEEVYNFLERGLLNFLTEETMNVLLIKDKDKVVGYACMQKKSNHMRLKETKYYDKEIGYIAMCAILPEYHSKGLYNLLTYIRIVNLIKNDSKRIFVRTQNAKVYIMITKILKMLEMEGIIKKYKLEFIKHEKGTFKKEIGLGLKIEKEKQPEEIKDLEVEKGDIGVYIWKIVK